MLIFTVHVSASTDVVQVFFQMFKLSVTAINALSPSIPFTSEKDTGYLDS